MPQKDDDVAHVHIEKTQAGKHEATVTLRNGRTASYCDDRTDVAVSKAISEAKNGK